jgi:uncharacterized cupin superfamily protein
MTTAATIDHPALGFLGCTSWLLAAAGLADGCVLAMVAADGEAGTLAARHEAVYVLDGEVTFLTAEGLATLHAGDLLLEAPESYAAGPGGARWLAAL